MEKAKQVRIEFSDGRLEGSGCSELFFVSAVGTDSNWAIQERSTWESQWYPPLSRETLVRIADAATRDWRAGKVRAGSRWIVADDAMCRHRAHCGTERPLTHRVTFERFEEVDAETESDTE